MSITEERINNASIEVLKAKEDFTKNTVKGWDYFQIPYSNINLISKKNSGKTTLIYNIIKNNIDKRTKVIIFSGSVNKDAVYKEIIKYLKKKDIAVETHGSFIENGVNILQCLLDVLKMSEKKIEHKKDGEDDEKIIFDDSSSRPKRVKKKKIVPEILLIFDDLGSQLRHQSISTLVKINRHPKIMNIFSFHAGTDVLPATQQQADYVIMFGGYPQEKLEKLYDQLVISKNYNEFEKLYKYATQDKYNFLYIDVRNNKYRKNFNVELKI
jgi:hypothetical protein